MSIAESTANYCTVEPKLLPVKVSYVLSFAFPSIWSSEIIKHDYAHIVSPDFFHLSRFRQSIIGTIHDLYILENNTKSDYSWYYRFFAKMDLNHCYDLLGVTTISKNTDRLFKHFFPKVKTKIIHHWTPDYFTKIDKTLCRKKHLIPNSKFVLLNVSFSSSNKNLDLLGKIMDVLSDEYLLIHIGNSKIICNNMNRILNINRYIDGQMLVEYYNAADLYLAPSTSEGFNFPVIEALNCGVPVLASDIEIFQEVLRNSPYLISFDIVEWKDAIISLSDRKSLQDAINWYDINIGNYYREKRGKREFMEFYNSLGVNV